MCKVAVAAFCISIVCRFEDHRVCSIHLYVCINERTPPMCSTASSSSSSSMWSLLLCCAINGPNVISSLYSFSGRSYSGYNVCAFVSICLPHTIHKHMDMRSLAILLLSFAQRLCLEFHLLQQKQNWEWIWCTASDCGRIAGSTFWCQNKKTKPASEVYSSFEFIWPDTANGLVCVKFVATDSHAATQIKLGVRSSLIVFTKNKRSQVRKWAYPQGVFNIFTTCVIQKVSEKYIQNYELRMLVRMCFSFPFCSELFVWPFYRGFSAVKRIHCHMLLSCSVNIPGQALA